MRGGVYSVYSVYRLYRVYRCGVFRLVAAVSLLSGVILIAKPPFIFGQEATYDALGKSEMCTVCTVCTVFTVCTECTLYSVYSEVRSV